MCLQETHIIKEDLNLLKKEWNVDYIVAGSKTNAGGGGVLMVIDGNFEHIIHERITSTDGRYIILDIEIPEVARMLIINLYAPNEDSPDFFLNLSNEIEQRDIKNIIMTGDWNMVIDFNKDTLNYKKLNNPKSNKIVIENKNKLDLIDIWRYSHPDLTQYTWKQLFYKKMAILDFFLMSETLLELYADSDIKNSYKSDHSPINLTLNISKHKRGWGNWKLNNSLLLDNEFKSKVEDEIELIISTYACTPYHPEFVKKNYKDFDFKLMIEIDLLWEVLNIQLRGLMMSLASNKKRKQNSEENKLSKEIKVLEETLKDNLNNNGWINELKETNDQLEEIREHKLKGALIRSRWQQSNKREKPSIFFLNLENKNYISKHIRELKIDNKIIQDPKQILEEMRLFYEKLYTDKNNIELEQSSLSHFKDKINKISDKEKEDLEKKNYVRTRANYIKK